VSGMRTPGGTVEVGLWAKGAFQGGTWGVFDAQQASSVRAFRGRTKEEASRRADPGAHKKAP
jgi:hypothetical protein